MTHVYRLAIQYPKLWLGPAGAPDTVRAAVAAAPGVLDDKGQVITNFLDEEAARDAAKFWRVQFALAQLGRLQGAEVVVRESDPVTWPDGSPS